MSQHLHHKLEVIHQSLLHGKLPRSLEWSDTLELIGHLGKVEPQGGEDFAFVVGSRREIFKRPHTHELGLDEVSRLRRFLKDAGHETAPDEPIAPGRMVVTIDHHGAHIYQHHEGNRQPDDVTVKPHDPHGFHRHLIHKKESNYQGQRVPEETSFYEEVAKALVPATEIVLIGHGTGKSSAVDVLTEYLKTHHAGVFQRVKAVETADLSALTEPEIDAIAKRHMSAPPA